jgi:hypothetical protein
MHEKKQNVPTAVDGGSLHMPSNFDDEDCAAAGRFGQTSTARINEIDRIRMMSSAPARRRIGDPVAQAFKRLRTEPVIHKDTVLKEQRRRHLISRFRHRQTFL